MENRTVSPAKKTKKTGPAIPAHAFRSNTAVQATSGYSSARQATYHGRSYTGMAGSSHYRNHRGRLINEVRAHYRDNDIFAGMINTCESYIIGTGFTLQPLTKNAAYIKKLTKLWNKFWHSPMDKPDIKGLSTGTDIEKMICRELLQAGDMGIAKDPSGKVRLIEAEQIEHPPGKNWDAKKGGKPGSLVDGIRTDDKGRVLGYYVAPYRSGYVNAKDAQYLTAGQFIFIPSPSRPSAMRAVPPWQPAFPLLDRIMDVIDSEAIGWQLLSRFAVAITKEGGALDGIGNSKTDPEKTGADTSGDITDRVTDVDPALIFWGEKGESVSGIDRTIPGKNFTESLRMFIRLMGLPQGLPLELALLDWSGANYSVSRAILEQAFNKFGIWQDKIGQNGLTPILEWKIMQWESEGALSRRPDDLELSWIAPTFPWIDQLKEAHAKGKMLDRGLITHAEVCRSRNRSRGTVIRERDLEVREALDIAMAIHTDEKYTDFLGTHNITIPFEIFCGLEPPRRSAGRPGGAAPAPGIANNGKDPNGQSE